MLLLTFTMVAYADGLEAEISIDADTKTVTVQASGLVADSMVSVLAYYDDDIDYIDQYVADEEGNLEFSYPSGKEWHEEGAIAVLINGTKFTLGGEEEVELNGIKIKGDSTLRRRKTSEPYTIVCDPEDATCEVVWETLTPSLVEIDENGVVTAKNATGFAVIKATTEDGAHTAQFTVRITA